MAFPLINTASPFAQGLRFGLVATPNQSGAGFYGYRSGIFTPVTAANVHTLVASPYTGLLAWQGDGTNRTMDGITGSLAGFSGAITMTIAAKIPPASGRRRGFLVVRNSSSADAIVIFHAENTNAGEVVCRLNNTAGGIYKALQTGSNTWDDDIWHVITLSWDGSSLGNEAWVDGVADHKGTGGTSGTQRDTAGTVRFGTSNQNNLYYQGDLAAIFLHNRYMEQGEAVAFYHEIRCGLPTLLPRLPYVPGVTQAAGGTVSGTGAYTLPSLTYAGAGDVIISGTGVYTLPSLTYAGVGDVYVSGTGTFTLPSLTYDGAGDVIVSGTGTYTLPSLTYDGTNITGVTGTGSYTLPSFTLAGTGTTPFLILTGTYDTMYDGKVVRLWLRQPGANNSGGSHLTTLAYEGTIASGSVTIAIPIPDDGSTWLYTLEEPGRREDFLISNTSGKTIEALKVARGVPSYPAFP